MTMVAVSLPDHLQFASARKARASKRGPSSCYNLLLAKSFPNVEQDPLLE
jgi:hypothetical protein